MPKKSRKNVGLIGLGIIGSRVANALRVGGFHVYVWNRTPRAAPNFLASPRQIAELCDVIQLFVADAQALFDVLDAMGDALTASHIIVCNATVGPEATLEAARMVQERGGQFLDAPFSGSKTAAQNRELVYYIGGDDKTLQAVETVLQASSKEIVKIGKVGDAATVKVATNMITAVTVQTITEAYAIVKESGIDPRRLADALKPHAARSGLSDAKLEQILAKDYEPHFSLKHMFKDVQLGIHIANSLDLDLPATTATAGVMYGGLTKGWADKDFSVIARTYQKEMEQAALPAQDAEAEKGPAPTTSTGAVGTVEEKKMVPRESTADELRDMGIKVPEAEKEEEAKVESTATEVPKPEVPKPEEPKLEAPNAEASKAEVPKTEVRDAEAPKVEAPKTEITKTEAPETEAAKVEGTEAAGEKESNEAEKSKAGTGSGGNGAEGEAERQHTPFVRIRRWFGTGSPS